MFKDDLTTEQFKRDVFKKIEAGEITSEEIKGAATIDKSLCCGQPITKNLRCSLCQTAHSVKGTEFIIDQDNRLHLIREDKE